MADQVHNSHILALVWLLDGHILANIASRSAQRCWHWPAGRAGRIEPTSAISRLVAVAVLMMRWQRTDLPLDADLARFMASLNVRELRRLARTGSRTSGRIDR
jgi:hypothetical protein